MAAFKNIGVVATLAFAISVATPLWNFLGSALAVDADIHPADAIVVLSAGMNGAMLGEESLRRFMYGVALYKQGLAPRLILCGPPASPRVGARPEAEVRKDLAITLGVPAEGIVTLPTVLTTRDEAEQTAARVMNGGGSILLVTSALHMRRAAGVFERYGLHVFSAPSDDWPRYAIGLENRIKLLRSVLMNASGLLYYKLMGYV